MSLKDKITTKEELLLRITAREFAQHEANLLQNLPRFSDSAAKVHWWAVRESARIVQGFYEMTDALISLNSHRQTFAHVSAEDRNMVAFTPDAVFGAADKQLRISFGKLVARLIPFAADDYVRDLTAKHLAELSDEVEWIEGLDIAAAYANDNSVGACMSAKPYFKIQPTTAYAAEGIKMAVLRKPNGELKARAMVVESKKVYIRAYGDTLLKKRLERLGYQVGTWEGVKFNTTFLDIPRSEYRGEEYKRVVVPYLDGNNTTCSTNYSSTALIDNQLVVVTREQIPRLNAISYTTIVPNTVGYVDLKNLDSKEFMRKCFLTGRDINTLMEDTEKFVEVTEAGEQKWHTISKDFPNEILEDGAPKYAKAKVAKNGTMLQAFVVRKKTFLHRYSSYSEDLDTRKALGFVKLSTKYYETSDWVTDAITIRHGDDSHFIKSEDVVRVVESENFTKLIHKSEVTKDMVRLAPNSDMKGYAKKEVKIFRTQSGAKVHPAHNKNITETFLGYDYNRNVKRSTSVLGVPIMVPKGVELTSTAYTDYLEKVYAKQLEDTLMSHEYDFVFAAKSVSQESYYYRVWPSTGNKFYTRQDYLHNLDDFRHPEMALEMLTDLAKQQTNVWTRRAVNDIVRMVADALAVEEPVRAISPTVKENNTTTFESYVDERFAIVA
jgi:hypothetical protein